MGRVGGLPQPLLLPVGLKKTDCPNHPRSSDQSEAVCSVRGPRGAGQVSRTSESSESDFFGAPALQGPSQSESPSPPAAVGDGAREGSSLVLSKSARVAALRELLAALPPARTFFLPFSRADARTFFLALLTCLHAGLAATTVRHRRHARRLRFALAFR